MAEKKTTSKKTPSKKVSTKADPVPQVVRKRNAFQQARPYKQPFKRPRKV